MLFLSRNLRGISLPGSEERLREREHAKLTRRIPAAMLPVRALTARYTPTYTGAFTEPNSLMALTLALTRANMLTPTSANTITLTLTGTL